MLCDALFCYCAINLSLTVMVLELIVTFTIVVTLTLPHSLTLYLHHIQVLTMQGYGKEADLWSVGVIMFLLLCGKLPFDGDDHNEIIRSTIQVNK